MYFIQKKSGKYILKQGCSTYDQREPKPSLFSNRIILDKNCAIKYSEAFKKGSKVVTNGFKAKIWTPVF